MCQVNLLIKARPIATVVVKIRIQVISYNYNTEVVDQIQAHETL